MVVQSDIISNRCRLCTRCSRGYPIPREFGTLLFLMVLPAALGWCTVSSSRRGCASCCASATSTYRRRPLRSGPPPPTRAGMTTRSLRQRARESRNGIAELYPCCLVVPPVAPLLVAASIRLLRRLIALERLNSIAGGVYPCVRVAAERADVERRRQAIRSLCVRVVEVLVPGITAGLRWRPWLLFRPVRRFSKGVVRGA